MEILELSLFGIRLVGNQFLSQTLIVLILQNSISAKIFTEAFVFLMVKVPLFDICLMFLNHILALQKKTRLEFFLRRKTFYL